MEKCISPNPLIFQVAKKQFIGLYIYKPEKEFRHGQIQRLKVSLSLSGLPFFVLVSSWYHLTSRLRGPRQHQAYLLLKATVPLF